MHRPGSSREYRFQDALEYAHKIGVQSIVPHDLAPVIEHIAKKNSLDAMCVVGALPNLFGFLTALDHRIIDEGLKLKADAPCVPVAISGAGKSPLLQMLLGILRNVAEIPARIPGGHGIFKTQGTNYAGACTKLPSLCYRIMFMWEEKHVAPYAVRGAWKPFTLPRYVN